MPNLSRKSASESGGPDLRVTTIGALCDVDQLADDEPWQAHFAVKEFADLSDGRRVTVSTDGPRGFGAQLNLAGREGFTSIWQTFSVASLEADVLTTLLPDLDEVDDEMWERRARTIREAAGLDVPSRDLRLVPYVVEFSHRVLERLPLSGSGN